MQEMKNPGARGGISIRIDPGNPAAQIANPGVSYMAILVQRVAIPEA